MRLNGKLEEYLQLNSSLCDRLKTAYWGRWRQEKGMSVLTQGHNEGFYCLWHQFPTFASEDLISKDFTEHHCILTVVLLVFIN
jgi:hypothetical protein